jgi:hypothetical protein
MIDATIQAHCVDIRFRYFLELLRALKDVQGLKG